MILVGMIKSCGCSVVPYMALSIDAIIKQETVNHLATLPGAS
jgi:hypothetical protein